MAKRIFEDALHLAELLAEFANLKPEDADAFRHSHPDFAPDRCWDWQRWSDSTGTLEILWKGVQQKVRDAWQSGFSPDSCIELIVVGANQSEMQDDIQAHEAAAKSDMGESEVAEFFRKHGERKRRIFEFQQAVMFLHVQSWRAARCEREQCRKYFVKDQKGRRFCSNACFTENRLADKLRWWRDKGTTKRAARSKQRRRKNAKR